MSAIKTRDLSISLNSINARTLVAPTAMSSTLYLESPKGSQFRLLKLMPGQWDDDLVATLYMASEHHRFTALSYTWGTSRRSQTIMVNNEVQYITFNLDHALRTLRSQNGSVVIWVDSLCIDQTNVEEKTHQVTLMHDLFYWAEDVHAYLGDSLDRSHPRYSQHFKQLGAHPHVHLNGDAGDDEIIQQVLFRDWPAATKLSSMTAHQLNLYAFCLLAALSQASWLKRIIDNQILCNKPETSNTSRALENAKLKALFEHLRAFAISPWWDRMWIVQEAGVARVLRLTYGKITIPFEALERARSRLERIALPSHWHQENMKVMSLLATKINTLSKLREVRSTRIENLVHGTRRSPLQGRYDYLALSMGSALLWLLRMFRNRRSSEPRDKVIALLQLRQDLGSFLNDSISPDYACTVHHLFTHVSFTIMRTTGIFWVTTGDLLSKSRHDIPSWVPDWSNDTTAYDPHHLSWKLPILFSAGEAAYLTDEKNKTTTQEHCRVLLQHTRFAPVLSKPWRLALAWVRIYDWVVRIGDTVDIDDGQALTTSFVSKMQRQRSGLLDGFKPQVALLTEGEFIDTITGCFDALIPKLCNKSAALMEMLRHFADGFLDTQRSDRSFDMERPLLDDLGRVLCSGVFKDPTGFDGMHSSWYRILPESRQEFIVSCVALQILGWRFVEPSVEMTASSRKAAGVRSGQKELFDFVFAREESCPRTEAMHLIFWPVWDTFSLEAASDVKDWGNDMIHHENPIHIFKLPPDEDAPPDAEMAHARLVVREVMASMSSICRPIMTRRGFFGLAPLNVKSGKDHIFAIPGATMPAVIRCDMHKDPQSIVESTMQNSQMTEKMGMEMIGTCYLDGVMDRKTRYTFMRSTRLCLL
ncbi:hypothetical protein BN1708_005970 [Verticillium longisporum]|uniref:Heterokaryon incompatibility domain-containing protein n=1 Tax=Verticillium longisporum TaxID=100787 RepID=A0A0G4MFF7_VERLO|nr:hypothetical protein BN1708_005970 [Verticillium longisporum]